jgi:hypothetical protein
LIPLGKIYGDWKLSESGCPGLKDEQDKNREFIRFTPKKFMKVD